MCGLPWLEAGQTLEHRLMAELSLEAQRAPERLLALELL
jgi:hypothetical protein